MSFRSSLVVFSSVKADNDIINRVSRKGLNFDGSESDLRKYQKAEDSFRNFIDRYISNFHACSDKSCQNCMHIFLPQIIELSRMQSAFNFSCSRRSHKLNEKLCNQTFIRGLELASASMDWAIFWHFKHENKKESATFFGSLAAKFSKALRFNDRPTAVLSGESPTTSRGTSSTSLNTNVNWYEVTIENVLSLLKEVAIINFRGSDAVKFKSMTELLISLTTSVIASNLDTCFEDVADLYLQFIERQFNYVESFLTVTGAHDGQDALKFLKRNVDTLDKLSTSIQLPEIAEIIKRLNEVTTKFETIQFLLFSKNLRGEIANVGNEEFEHLSSYIDMAERLFRPYQAEYPEIWIEILIEGVYIRLRHYGDLDGAEEQLQEVEKLLPQVKSQWSNVIQEIHKEIRDLVLDKVSKEIIKKTKEGLGPLIIHILQNYPPRHMPEFKLSEWIKELDKKTLDKKRTLIKIIKFYHPDKVDRKRFSKKYYDIVEEIGKILGGELAKIKG